MTFISTVGTGGIINILKGQAAGQRAVLLYRRGPQRPKVYWLLVSLLQESKVQKYSCRWGVKPPHGTGISSTERGLVLSHTTNSSCPVPPLTKCEMTSFEWL